MSRFSRRYSALFWLSTLSLALSLWLCHDLLTMGQQLSGMGQQVVWGWPHVCALFLIVTAAGVSNVASLASVFGRTEYQAWAALSGLLALALLLGGLLILCLDLGRPERLLLVMRYWQVRSVFAWNVLLYSLFILLAVLYIWARLDRRHQSWSRPLGWLALLCRLLLTTGSGAIFALLVARPAFQSALLPPLFIALSLAWGMAMFLLLHGALCWLSEHKPSLALQQHMAHLLTIFVAIALYLALVYHLSRLYYAHQSDFTQFIVGQSRGYAGLFWIGFLLLGNVLPLGLGYAPVRRGLSAGSILTVAALVLVGAFSFLTVFLIGSQVFPLPLFPGFQVLGAAGMPAEYTPQLAEYSLGLAGFACAALLTSIGIKAFPFLPRDN